MIFIICLIIVLTFAMIWHQEKIKQILLTIRYEIIYWFLGGAALVDDALFSWNNKLKVLPQKSNEVAVVTGGARGIGYEVVKKLLEYDMKVIIGCRRIEAGRKAVTSIRDLGVTTGVAEIFHLDTSSMKSVSMFAKDVLSYTQDIHVLINNAGIMFVPHVITEDGFESQFCVNYLGHFFLTHLLLSALKNTGNKSGNHTRIVNVSSCAHIPGSINFDDVNYLNTLYIPSQAYAQSKLAQLMFTKALDRKMQSEGCKVNSFAVHPGVVNTEIFEGTNLKRIAPWIPKLFFKTPEQGAISVIYAATSDSLNGQGGAYISNCRQTWVSPTAKNIEKQEKLMALSLQLLKLNDFGVTGRNESMC